MSEETENSSGETDGAGRPDEPVAGHGGLGRSQEVLAYLARSIAREPGAVRVSGSVEGNKAHLKISAEVIGCNTPHLLGYPDGEMENNLDLVGKLVRCIREVQPEVVFCPDPTAVLFGEEYINHRDHRIIGMATLDALSPAAAMPLYFPEAGKPHQVDYAYLSGTLEPSVWIDITASITKKVASIECQKSQVDSAEWIGDLIRERARGEGQKVGASFAESFRRVHTGA